MARRGVAIDDATLKAILEPVHNGKAVAINVDTGECVVADDLADARRLLREEYPPRTISMSRIIGEETDAGLISRILMRRENSVFRNSMPRLTIELPGRGEIVSVDVVVDTRA